MTNMILRVLSRFREKTGMAGRSLSGLAGAAVTAALLLGGGAASAQTIRVNPVADCPQQGYIQNSIRFGNAQDLNYGISHFDAAGNAYILSQNYWPYQLVLTKMSPAGTILWSSSLSNKFGDTYDIPGVTSSQLIFDGNYVYVPYQATSLSGITTGGAPVGPCAGMAGMGWAVAKVDMTTGTVTASYALALTNDLTTNYPNVWVKNGELYFGYDTKRADLPVTDGSLYYNKPAAPNQWYVGTFGWYYGKLSAAGALLFAGYADGYWNQVHTAQAQVVDNSGGSHFPLAKNNDQLYMVKMNPGGSIAWQTQVADKLNFPLGYFYDNKFWGSDGNNTYCVTDSAGGKRFTKLDASGNIVYVIPLNGVFNNNPTYYSVSLWVKGAYSYVAYTTSSDYNTLYTDPSGLVKIDNAAGTVVWHTRANMGPAFDLDVDASGNVWITNQTTNTQQATTNGSSYSGGMRNNFVAGFSGGTGDILFASYMGSSDGPYIACCNSKVYVTSGFYNTHYPTTVPNTNDNDGITWMAFAFNPDLSSITDTISPSSSAMCQLGAGQMLTGNKVNLALSPSVPQYYRDGVPANQPDGWVYQWQSSANGTTGWTDVPGATLQNYLPVGLTDTTYFRRVVKSGPQCTMPLHISNVAIVNVSGFTAPTLTAGSGATPYVTCPGSAVNIAMNVTGGTAPYTGSWVDSSGTLSAGTFAGSAATATVTPSGSMIYTAKVTDNNGCIQYGQAQVMAYGNGPNQAVSKCGSDSVLIGNIPVAAGVSGVTYAWTAIAPATANFANAANPQTKVLNAGKYLLTRTITKTNTGTCIARDTATVTVVTPPAATAPDGFAGPDVTICSPANGVASYAIIGNASFPGSFSYTWAPGSYLSSNNYYTTTVQLGSVLPQVNPITYYLTATNGTCTFVDSMVVRVLRADAGIDGCGPRTIGNPVDATPGITGKTYTWTRLDNGAGAAAISGATNMITASVTSGSIDTRFVVTVSAPGAGSCTDTVLVTAGCTCVNSRIDVHAPGGCPRFVSGGPAVGLEVVTPGVPSSGISYDWYPKSGLDRYDSSYVTLTDGNPHTYTVRLKDKNTGDTLCSITRDVNGIAWSYPVFAAKDTLLCPLTGSATTTVALGQTAVAGYSYQWSGTGLSSSIVSNPTFTVGVATAAASSFVVTVTDGISGCTTTDTATVKVIPVIVNAGPDQVVCNSANITLANGVDSVAGYRYAWTPSLTWADGTDSTWLHAKVATATNTSFVLYARDLQTGCMASDTMNVIVNPSAALTVTAPATVCKGAPTVLSVPLYANTTYTWTAIPAGVLPAPATGLNTITVSPSVPTTYSVTANNLSGGCLAAGSALVAIIDLSYVPASHNNYCPASGAASLVLGPSAAPAAGAAPYTYSWSPAAAVNTPASRNTTPVVAPGVDASYVLTITDATGCSASVTENVSVAQGSRPEAGADRTMCLGATEVLGNASNTGVTWFAAGLPATTALLAGGINAAAPSFTPVAAGTYKFYVQYTSGLCVNPDTIILTVRANPALNATGATLCSGADAAALIGTAAVAGLTYQWSPATGLDDANASQTLVHAATAMPDYLLTAKDGYGCQTAVHVPVSVTIPAPLVAVPDLELCQGGASAMFMTTVNGSAVSNGSSQYAAVWTPPALLSNAGVIRPMVMPFGDTGMYTYNVRVVDQATGCNTQATAQANIIICSTPLPVKLLAFTAQAQHNRTALLNWNTASETDLVQFGVESSVDASNWNTIGNVTAAGDNSAYHFIDENPLADVMYYRLKMQNLDGSRELSPVRQVSFDAVKASGNVSVAVYPNPTNGNISLRASATMERVQLLDLTGQLLMEQHNVTDGSILELPGRLASGVYILNCYVNGQVRNIKLVLNR